MIVLLGRSVETLGSSALSVEIAPLRIADAGTIQEASPRRKEVLTGCRVLVPEAATRCAGQGLVAESHEAPEIVARNDILAHVVKRVLLSRFVGGVGWNGRTWSVEMGRRLYSYTYLPRTGEAEQLRAPQ